MAMVVRSPSSPSSMYSCFSYDVFLSFRGEDTRKAFTDHLYKALKQAGIRTFRDDDAMERGRLLKPELEKAIHESAVSLIVFSKGYATSKWCLDEVLIIMEEYDQRSSSTNKHQVVPVFYNIDPTDVRNQTGCFEEAFNGYDEKIREETDVQKKKELSDKVKAWRGSLKKAGSLTGMVLAEDGYEAKFITGVVKVIQKKLNYNALYIDDKLVGITGYIAEIESWLQDPSPNAMIFVIDGMGGIGKTTIAKCVYNSNFREYDCSCFLANINDASSQPNGMLRLQSQLLSTILKSEKEETVWNEYEGTTKITDAIWHKKVLLVLDDVTTSQQLNALLGPQRFYPGSKVIVTTRHKWLITNFNVHPKGQTIETLPTPQSIELFSLYAFDQNQPIEQRPPSSFYMYKERGPQISFIIPSHPQHRIISGFNLSLLLSPTMIRWFNLRIKVYNMTKDLEWNYWTGSSNKEKKVRGWLSVWRCDNLLHSGDQIFVRILDEFDKDDMEVEECCINIIYEDDDEVEVEVEVEDQGERTEVSEYDDNNEIIIRLE